jgi:hypothetical protein
MVEEGVRQGRIKSFQLPASRFQFKTEALRLEPITSGPKELNHY